MKVVGIVGALEKNFLYYNKNLYYEKSYKINRIGFGQIG